MYKTIMVPNRWIGLRLKRFLEGSCERMHVSPWQERDVRDWHTRKPADWLSFGRLRHAAEVAVNRRQQLVFSQF